MQNVKETVNERLTRATAIDALDGVAGERPGCPVMPGKG
jgi:hypothetical protein